MQSCLFQEEWIKQEKNKYENSKYKQKHPLSSESSCHSSISASIFFALWEHFTNHEVVIIVPHHHQFHLHQLGHQADVASIGGYLDSIAGVRQLNDTEIRWEEKPTS